MTPVVLVPGSVQCRLVCRVVASRAPSDASTFFFFSFFFFFCWASLGPWVVWNAVASLPSQSLCATLGS